MQPNSSPLADEPEHMLIRLRKGSREMNLVFRPVWVFALWLILGMLPFTAEAATIVLKNGTQLQTPKLWLENAQIHFVLDGLPAVIAPKDIARLEDAPETVITELKKWAAAKPPPAKPRQKATKIPPAQATPATPPTVPAATPPSTLPAPTAEPTAPHESIAIGFKNLTWEDQRTDIPGLKLFDEDPSFGGIQRYRQPQAQERFGNAPLKEVVYGFWRDRFYTLTILVAGKSDFEALKKEAFRRFGEGVKTDASREVYIWYGGLTDRMLEYDANAKLGMLWMRSAELNSEVSRTMTMSALSPVVP